MKYPLILALALISSTSAFADAWRECKDSNDVGACINQKYDESDAALNDIYQVYKKCIGNPSTNLVAAEKSWIAFRDSECLARQALFGGHSSETFAQEKQSCLTELTRNRTTQITDAVEEAGCN